MTAQRTLAAPAHVEGYGLHLGEKAHVEFLPAPVGSGICFVRTDLPGLPKIEANLANLASRPRRTALVKGEAEVHTIEHLMASLWALGIQNLEARLNGPELPGLDGSSLPYYEALKAAGIVDQDASRRGLEVAEPVAVSGGEGASIVALREPSCLRVSYTLAYDSPALDPQYYSLEIDEETFAREIAPARTFVLEDEARLLQAEGLGRGANTKNTLVLGRDGRIIDNELRFENEFVRHKILDLVGDLYLTNSHVCAHVLATKSGHTLNVELARSIVGTNGGGAAAAKLGRSSRGGGLPEGPQSSLYGYTGPLDVAAIEKVLPHRYPFLFVDRVIEVSKDGRYAKGVKNVSVNEEFFRGHFPGEPVMPGVLQIEAMAQLAGIMLHSHEQYAGSKAYLLSVDKVKFRRLVVPGDCLVLEAHLKAMKKRSAIVDTVATVSGSTAAEAHIRFMMVPED